MGKNEYLSRLRILVVDDEEFILNLTRRVLENIGCMNVETAMNGEQAIEQLTGDGRPFDIVICDLKMPDMDGFEFMQKVAEWDARGGLIILSAEDKHTIKKAHKLAKSKNLNILGVIPKPLDQGVLKKLLKKFQYT
ncbi:MAG: CheY-like chemotaxis protein [Gammaproteobacteria bacterium]|jgi:CheY-like chemotaxis protein